MNTREKILVRLLRSYGYRLECFETKIKLHVLSDHLSSGYELPYAFRSVQQAAEHLIPIIRDDAYRIAVIGE